MCRVLGLDATKEVMLDGDKEPACGAEGEGLKVKVSSIDNLDG